MRALLLAGGKATRLHPLTLTLPKAMTPLLGRPFLAHVLAWLRRHDVREVTLLLGHLADAIRNHFGDGRAYGVRLDYVVEVEPLGSGGAIKQLERSLTAPFFALNADIFTDLDLQGMVAAHRAAGAEVTMALAEVDDPSMYGVVAVDAGGWIARFVEKPPRAEAPSRLVNAGTWLFEPAAVRRIAAGRFSMVEQELFPELAGARRLLGYVTPCYWIDAGTPQRYLQLHRDLLGGRAQPPFPLVEQPGWPGLVLVAPGAGAAAGPPPALEAGARLDGPVTLGPAAHLGAGATVAGPASLGAGVRLEEGAVVADSVLWDGGRVGRRARVTGSVLAAGCVVGPGARVADSVLGDRVQVRPGATVTGASVPPGETVG
jgi:mannose-1-phosphate guanylyltransferase